MIPAKPSQLYFQPQKPGRRIHPRTLNNSPTTTPIDTSIANNSKVLQSSMVQHQLTHVLIRQKKKLSQLTPSNPSLVALVLSPSNKPTRQVHPLSHLLHLCQFWSLRQTHTNTEDSLFTNCKWPSIDFTKLFLTYE